MDKKQFSGRYLPRPPGQPRVQTGDQRNYRSPTGTHRRFEEFYLPSISPNCYTHNQQNGEQLVQWKPTNTRQTFVEEILYKKRHAKELYENEMDKIENNYIEENRLHSMHLRAKTQALNRFAEVYSEEMSGDFHRIRQGLEKDINCYYQEVQRRNESNCQKITLLRQARTLKAVALQIYKRNMNEGIEKRSINDTQLTDYHILWRSIAHQTFDGCYSNEISVDFNGIKDELENEIKFCLRQILQRNEENKVRSYVQQIQRMFDESPALEWFARSYTNGISANFKQIQGEMKSGVSLACLRHLSEKLEMILKQCDLLRRALEGQEYYQNKMNEVENQYIKKKYLHSMHDEAKSTALKWLDESYSFAIARDFHRVYNELENGIQLHFEEVLQRNKRNKKKQSMAVVRKITTVSKTVISGVSSALSGAEIGMSIGQIFGQFGGFAGLVIGALCGGLLGIFKKYHRHKHQ
ncbi:unnamed protein product [Clavelina lepadiformis]|uniref:Uncharacterized protein n=1 Tax=Clavelina lepadiformis TaxID=159417 RepID=A0ABP0EWQ1_CLALP